jgi:chromosome segregation protein
MQIRRLKLHGFKSFVDATELRIEPGLTGIVGPNGCGKSNLLEAIRWVMGEASARAMRGGGMEDVIFAGTATRPQRDFAEVSLSALYDQGESLPAFDIGGDGELEVIRRIERGTGSAYRANGRDVRAKDVALLFADAATGAHSPALVSQGKIAAVIAARPQERRAMLEEAAGIAGLHVRRKDAEQKLRAAETNLARLDEILTDMDNRAASLRRQARAAERYTRLSEQIKLAEARTLYARWRDAAAIAEAAQHEAISAQAAVDSAHEAQNAAAAYVAVAIEAFSTARSAAQSARDAASEARHHLLALKTQAEQATRRLAELAEQASRIEDDRARESALAQDAVEAIARLGEEIAALKSRITQAQATAPDHAERITIAREAARDAELDLAKAMAKQASEQAEVRVADAALAAARNRLERSQRDVERLEQESAALADPAPLMVQRDAALQSIALAGAEIASAQAHLAQAQSDHGAATVARSEAQSALSSARAALAALDSEASALRRDTESAQSKGPNSLINALRAAPGYERALAAALGDDLDISLDTAAPIHWGGAPLLADDPALPAGTTSLADYVSAPPQIARRLAQIAVVESDDGQPLNAGQRIVTCDGQMRRWDGFVAKEGGASAAQRLLRLNRLEALEAQRPDLLAQVDMAQQDLTTAERSLVDASAAMTATRSALSQSEQAQATASRARDDLTAALDRIAQRANDYAQRIGEAQQEHSTLLTEYNGAQAARGAMPDSSDTSQLVATLSAQSEKAHAAVSQLQADAALAQSALQADSQRLLAAETETKGWRTRSGDAVKRSADMLKRAQAIANEQQKLADLPTALAAQVQAHEAQCSVLNAQAENARKAEAEADAALRTAEAKHAKAGEALSQARESRASATARADNAQERRIEIAQNCGERFECPPAALPEKLDFDPASIAAAPSEQAELDRLSQERERIGPVNLVAASELLDLEQAQEISRIESTELTQAIHQLRGSIGSLNREGRARLLAAFEAVDGHFRRLFTTLFNGGQARLELVDSDDPLEAGLEILAQPPGKKLSTLTLLSGGEQALTAVALIFGLFLTNPAPICVLDEVDAPLDDANVERFCHLLDQMVRDTKTRYLIVTHNAVTMARMHRLFGVTMVEQGISRLVSVDLGGAEELLAAE